MNTLNSLLRSFILLLFLTGATKTGYGQSWQWAKGEGDIGNDAAFGVTVDDAGNSYVTGNIAGRADFSGTIYQGSGIYDLFVAKYGPNGDLLWVKLGGGPGNDQGNSIKWSNGYLYVCGSFEGTATFSGTTLTSKGEGDMFLAKYGDGGNLIWIRSGGGTGLDYGQTVDVGSNGDVLVGGAYETAMKLESVNLTTTNIYYESFYARYGSTGNLIWAKSTSGNNPNMVTGLAFDHNNALYITGYFGGSLRADNTTVNSVSSSYDIFLAKVSEGDGSLTWIKRAGSLYEDAGHAVTCDLQGNPTITGYFAGTASFDGNQVTYNDYNDIFTARYDANGNNLWVRAGKGLQLDVPFAITSDATGNLFVTGMFQGAIDFDGNALTGGDREVFVVSYDNNGALRWLAQAGGSDTDCWLGIAVSGNGSLLLCGYYVHTGMFGNVPVDYASGTDLFIAKYSPPPVGINNLSVDLDVVLYPNPSRDNCVLKAGFNTTGCTYTLNNQLGAALYT
ncbi:MAG: hypothetical protein KA149_06050, partial [Chitinophagales bacterium]|nr:hypothetical protein [Chitinophagales bacterium]